MNCKKKIDAAVQRITQYLKDEGTVVVPPPGWLTGEAIATELALIQHESTHLEEVINETMDELAMREHQLVAALARTPTLPLPPLGRC